MCYICNLLKTQGYKAVGVALDVMATGCVVIVLLATMQIIENL